MGRPRIAPKIVKLIKDKWTDEMMKERDMSWSETKLEAIDELEKKLRSEGLSKKLIDERIALTFPSDRKGQDIVKQAREEYDEIPQPRREEIEKLAKPWGIALSSKYGIPAEAIPSVLQIQKLRFLEGSDIDRYDILTIREAQWVARLYKVIPNNFYLKDYALSNASYEQKCEVEGIEFNSIYTDMSLALNYYEYCTVNHDKELDEWYILEEDYHRKSEEWDASEWSELISNAEWPLIAEEVIDEGYVVSGDAIKLLEGEQTSWEEDKSETQIFMYIYWLKYLRKRSKIGRLPIENRIDVINQLRRWIEMQPSSHKFIPNEIIENVGLLKRIGNKLLA